MRGGKQQAWADRRTGWEKVGGTHRGGKVSTPDRKADESRKLCGYSLRVTGFGDAVAVWVELKFGVEGKASNKE